MVSQGMEPLASVKERTHKKKIKFLSTKPTKNATFRAMIKLIGKEKWVGSIGVRQEGAYKISGALGGEAELREHGDEEIIRKPVEVVRPRLRRRRSKPPSFPDAGFCPLLALFLIPARASLDDPSASSPAMGSHCRRVCRRVPDTSGLVTSHATNR